MKKLSALRLAMFQAGINVYIIPLADNHLQEYVPAHWNIVRWLTGFTGSAGILAITADRAELWTDSRYLIQAENELSGSGFTLAASSSFRGKNSIDWLESLIAGKSMVGFDGRIVSVNFYRNLHKRLVYKNVSFVDDADLIGGIWKDRPGMPSSAIWKHPPEFSGMEHSDKIASVRKLMKQRNISLHILTSPDDIMWLLNLRGNDLKYSPVALSFAIIAMDRLYFFVDQSRLPQDIAENLILAGVTVFPYGDFTEKLKSFHRESFVLINPARISVSVFNALSGSYYIVEDENIPTLLKAKKNETEIRNILETMIKDGLALVRFFIYLESSIENRQISEMSLAARLEEIRSADSGFLGSSFASIVAFNDHASLPHYSPTVDTDVRITTPGLLLLDSGGHYPGGTTDITRTICLGRPTTGQKRDFTLVLKGHIRLAGSKFPAGTKGHQLDILAREALWQAGMDYGHGTGHGVGYCLNVHEGPHSISPVSGRTALEAGMIVSNEPAIYREGEYGIRTENLMLCCEDEETEFGKFLRFETLSLCHIDKSLIDKSMMTDEEIAWLNGYHAAVFEKLSPWLNDDEKEWLRGKTEKL
ncbi:MAG TPA: aminopeptidase P family protein [Bacteroidales bacterium]|nr:aminopeptidase P family protein [Bacteroidales bacterium]HQJ81276.1 aminopeptidase P family protein [Bacteroidales bacterium]